MALRRKVHDDVRLLLLKQVKHELPVRDVPADELVVGGLLHLRQVLQVARVGQKIQVYDLMLRVLLHHMNHKIGTDEAGSSCHDYLHLTLSPLSICFARRGIFPHFTFR